MSREDFEATWLAEMPVRTPPIDVIGQLSSNIKERISLGRTPIDLGGGFFKIEGIVTYYWYEHNGIVLMAVELEEKPQALVVAVLGKDLSLKGRPPYASDMYSLIAKDSKKGIRLMSDIQMTDAAMKVWKKLVSNGVVVSVYDRASPSSYQSFRTPDELDQFFGTDPSMKKYQFVISESGEPFADMNSLFRLRQLREHAGLL